MNPLKKYAELAVRKGVNVQKGQLVVITAPVENYEFARLVQEAAYEAGASEVMLDYVDEVAMKEFYLHASDESLDYCPQWKVARFEELDAAGACYLHLLTEHPDIHADADSQRVSRYSRALRQALKAHYKRLRAYDFRWGMVTVPSKPWAKKVFPHLNEDEAMDKLWQDIMTASRANGDDPIRDWSNHGRNFEARIQFLNGKQFDSLHFSNEKGTKLTMGLPQNHVFIGGGAQAKDGLEFYPNIPTEEIFTAPHKYKVDGTLIGTKPLIYGGTVIENFVLTFKEGKIEDYRADANEETLKSLIELDAGTSYLGEIALVSNVSPLAKTGTLFYNNLIDENTACHIGVGAANLNNAIGADQLSERELEAAGLNTGLVLINATFGSDDMRVAGIKGGAETIIMENGDFVI